MAQRVFLKESSAVHSYRYDPDTKVLTLWWKGSPPKAYLYFGVTKEEIAGLVSAPSVGAYVNAMIKKFHNYLEVPK